MKRAITILLLPLFLCSMLWAQKSRPKELHFNRLFVKDGLPEGRIQSVVQDKQGYIWLGTQKGLVRYDGYKPKVYELGIEDPYHMSIIKVYIGKEDRLWVAGLNGVLYLYDRSGDRFIPYRSNSSAADSSSLLIYNLHEDQFGHVWLLFYDQVRKKSELQRFDLSTKKFIKYDQDEKGAHYINATGFTNFFEEKKEGIWVGSDNGIYQYNEKTDHFDAHLAVDDSTKRSTFFLSAYVARPGILWMSVFESKPPQNALGLWRYNTRTNTTTAFRHQTNDSSSIASDITRGMCIDSMGRLWEATDKGISLIEPAKNSFTNYYLKGTSKGTFIGIQEIQVDKNNNFWLATDEGLVFFDTQTGIFTRYQAHEKDPYGLANSYVRSLFIDRSGTLWFGASQIGLQWINKPLSRFVQYKDNPGQLHNFPGGVVTAFAESKDSSIWLATSRGLYHWQPRTDSFTLVKFGRGKDNVLNISSLTVDKDGRVWFGAWGNPGLRCYDPTTGRTRYFRNNKKDTTSISYNDVNALFQDHLGDIWVGVWGNGIARFNQKSQNFTRFPYIENTNSMTPDNGVLDDDQVELIYEDKSGTLWVGTNNGGLNKFNRQTGRFTSYNNQLPGFQCVTSIYEDATNKLWTGTYFGGLFSFDPKTSRAEKYTEKNGLLYDGADGIVADSKENLWLATFRGISIFNPKTKQVRNLTTANGLSSESLITAFKTSSGQFLFSSYDGGFISLNPDDFTPDPHPPIVQIESVDFVAPNAGKAKDSTLVIYGKDSINFRYNENRLSFHYVGLYYQNSQLNQYAYKLDGYDKVWIPAGTQRSVTYTNLSPGHYTFHVKAANSDGIWTEQGASFSFTILAPWWQTWWAYTLYILVFVLAVWAFAAYRSRALRRANQVLEEKVEHRTSQLNKSIDTLKATQSQLIQSEKMASLGELTAGIAHEIQNPLNFVNNFSEVNKELIAEMKLEIDNGNYEEAKTIAIDIEENEQKINHHGKRADSIVKGMLQHSRSGNSIKESTDINALADEYLRLSYHGLRAKDNSFNVSMKTDFDESIGNINIIPQDIGRVVLNLITNAFYAVDEKKKQVSNGFVPTVSVSTKKINGKVEVSVKDNGNGIPQKVFDKIFQPFFTTKPTGQGTGLGLSLSYDIIKAHGGEIKVVTKEGEGSEFIIELPAS